MSLSSSTLLSNLVSTFVTITLNFYQMDNLSPSHLVLSEVLSWPFIRNILFCLLILSDSLCWFLSIRWVCWVAWSWRCWPFVEGSLGAWQCNHPLSPGSGTLGVFPVWASGARLLWVGHEYCGCAGGWGWHPLLQGRSPFGGALAPSRVVCMCGRVVVSLRRHQSQLKLCKFLLGWESFLPFIDISQSVWTSSLCSNIIKSVISLKWSILSREDKTWLITSFHLKLNLLEEKMGREVKRYNVINIIVYLRDAT